MSNFIDYDTLLEETIGVSLNENGSYNPALIAPKIMHYADVLEHLAKKDEKINVQAVNDLILTFKKLGTAIHGRADSMTKQCLSRSRGLMEKVDDKFDSDISDNARRLKMCVRTARSTIFKLCDIYNV